MPQNHKDHQLFTHMLNNRYIIGLVIAILVAILLLLLTQLDVLFRPIWQFINTILLPVIIGGVLYYLTVPLVNLLERHGVKRVWGTWIVLALLAVIVGLFIAWIPFIVNQAKDFFSDWGEIWQDYQRQLLEFFRNSELSETPIDFDRLFDYLNGLDWNWGKLFNNTISGISSFFGTVTRIVIGLVTAPIVLFYMLKDAPKFKPFIAQFIPTKIRPTTLDMLGDINEQVSSYIRGQILVAIAVAIMFVIGYAIIGLDYGLIIGITAGALNVIPYLGSFLGMIPALIIGIVDSPLMFVKVLIVFATEQTIESRVVSPMVIGSNLHIHPVVIMLLIIAGGDLWGIPGIIFTIPIFAILRVIFNYLFRWYREVSGLYEEE